MNVVIRVPNWLGDIIMSIPAIKSLKKSNPEIKISVICKKGLDEIFTLLEEVEEIIPYEKNKLLKNAKLLNKKGFDTYISFPNSLESAILGLLSGIPERIGYSKDLRCQLLTKCFKREKDILNQHHIFYYLNLLKKAELIKDYILDLSFTKKEILTNLKNLTQRKFSIEKKRFILGIHPGAAYGKTKMWPPEKYRELIKKILENFDATIYLVGSKSEENTSLEIAKNLKNVHILTGKTTILELVGVILNCNIFISNDSGPMHLAAALSIPQIAIFGSTDPVITSPYNKSTNIILKGITHCSPCFLKECPTKDFKCFEKIKVNDVFHSFASLFEKYRSL